MPFDIILEEGEQLIANLSFGVPHDSDIFHLALTNRAVFLPRKKFFAVKDATYFERVPLNRIVEAKIKKLSPVFLWALALLMVAVGTVITCLMMIPLLRREGGEFSGYPPAVALVGLVIPIIARRRYGLSISIVDGGFLWKPRLHVDKTSRNAVDAFLTQVAESLRQAGVNVKDERDRTVSITQGKPCPCPTAMRGDSPNQQGVLRPCCRCGKFLKISRWDDWNGFLLRCPYCGGIHGKPWSAYWLLLASVLLNAFSLFFIMRWRRALPLFLGFALFDIVAGVALDHVELSETLKLVLLATSFLLPSIVNSILLLKHEMALKTPSITRT
jgi:hypothetical protein